MKHDICGWLHTHLFCATEKGAVISLYRKCVGIPVFVGRYLFRKPSAQIDAKLSKLVFFH